MKLKNRFALLSVSDKRGIENLARGLVDLGYTLISTEGTAQAIADSGLPVTHVSDFTGTQEILEGRVMTLHPRIFAGILAKDTEEHHAEIARNKGVLIDLVVVNLFPFEQNAADPAKSLWDLVDSIDVGGPGMLRGAAKNFARVAAVCDTSDYETILWHLAHDYEVPLDMRFQLAIKAFAHTTAYDAAVFQTLPDYELETGARSE